MTKELITIAALVLFIGWVIYPGAMWLMSTLRRAAPEALESSKGAASVVIATRDAIEVVSRRIANLEGYRDELDSLEIIVAVDSAGPISPEQYRRALGERAVVVTGDAPGGKSATLNAGVRAARNDIVLFTDSAQEYLPGALRGLVATVRRPGIGAASGRIALENNRRSVLLTVFWTYESWLRSVEARVDSIVGVTGAIYGLRKDLWDPLPAGLINDDVYVAHVVVRKGYRVVTCESAFAVDRRVFAAGEEFTRKVRTLTGVLQLCALCPSILNPWKNRVWLQFVFHKLLRFSTPYWLVLGALGVLLAYPKQVAAVVLAACGASVLLAVVWPRSGLVARVWRQLGWSVLLLSAPFVATVNGLRGHWDVWDASARGAK